MKHRRYIIQEKLGSGGMGSVYTAKDRLTGEIVALKRVLISSEKTTQTSNTEFLTALATEFRTLAGLRHPYIVRVIDYGFSFDEGQPQPYFTMEYLPNAKTITDTVSDQSLETQVRLLTEMLMALAYLHRRGVIHRDLKPDNVLVDSTGRVKVLDFGLAFETSGKSNFSSVSDTAGTLAYMAPELVAGGTATVQSDLYAAGIVIYEILSGRFPFNQTDNASLFNDIIYLVPDTSMFNVELGSLLARLLSKDPKMRPSSAEEMIKALCEATDQPLPLENIAIRESFLQASRFVGRRAEMSLLKTALNQAINGQNAQIYLIGGESGVGKSRLLDELRASALVKGAMVLRGQGIAEGGLPFQLWRDIARELALNTELKDLEASILKEIVPDISTLLGYEVVDAPQLSSGGGQQRLMQTLVDLLKRQTHPTLLLLEDLQWAEGSLAPLKQILTAREQFPALLVIGAYRDDESPNLPSSFPSAQAIKLSRLDDDAIADLTQSMLGEIGTQPNILHLLKRETEGNAFFMVETVRALAENAGTLGNIGSQSLPQQVFAGGVGAIIRRRLSRVPDSYRPLLQEMAVAGRWLDLRVLEITSSRHTEDINSFLTICADTGVLEIVEGHWRFTHDKLRETVLRDLSETERRNLHQKVAIAIESAYPDDENYYEILLEHWRVVGDTTKELYYLVPVIRYWVDTRADLERAVILADYGLTMIGENNKHRPTLLNLLGKIKWQMNDYPTALQWAEQAQTAAEKLGDRQNLADSLRTRGQVLTDKGDYPLAIDYFQQSLAINHELGNRQGIADNLLTIAIVFYNQGDYSRAEDYYQQSLAIYRELGDQVGIANNLGNLGNVAECLRDFQAAKSYAEQAMKIFQAIGNQRNVAVCMSNLGNLAYQEGDYELAKSYLQQSLIGSRETDHPLHTAFALNTIGLVELAQGNLPRAALLFYEALALAETIDALPTMLEILTCLARLNLRISEEVFAAELAGMIEHHPSLDDEVRMGELVKLKQELGEILPLNDMLAAAERGKALDAKTVTRKILSENIS